MRVRVLITLITLLCGGFRMAHAMVEFKTNILPSIAQVGRTDVVLSTHNTILFGGYGFYMGVYGGYEVITQNVTDQTYGAAVRFGADNPYFELQGGYFQRDFREHGSRLTGKGFAANLGVGWHLTPNFGLSVYACGKRITQGDLDKRTIVDLLPFLMLRTEF
jgi:hypothetical protein